MRRGPPGLSWCSEGAVAEQLSESLDSDPDPMASMDEVACVAKEEVVAEVKQSNKLLAGSDMDGTSDSSAVVVRSCGESRPSVREWFGGGHGCCCDARSSWESRPAMPRACLGADGGDDLIEQDEVPAVPDFEHLPPRTGRPRCNRACENTFIDRNGDRFFCYRQCCLSHGHAGLCLCLRCARNRVPPGGLGKDDKRSDPAKRIDNPTLCRCHNNQTLATDVTTTASDHHDQQHDVSDAQGVARNKPASASVSSEFRWSLDPGPGAQAPEGDHPRIPRQGFRRSEPPPGTQLGAGTVNPAQEFQELLQEPNSWSCTQPPPPAPSSIAGGSGAVYPSSGRGHEVNATRGEPAHEDHRTHRCRQKLPREKHPNYKD